MRVILTSSLNAPVLLVLADVVFPLSLCIPPTFFKKPGQRDSVFFVFLSFNKFARNHDFALPVFVIIKILTFGNAIRGSTCQSKHFINKETVTEEKPCKTCSYRLETDVKQKSRKMADFDSCNKVGQQDIESFLFTSESVGEGENSIISVCPAM